MTGWRFQKWSNRRSYTWSDFLLLRLACLPLTSTWFVPDEVFQPLQSVEVAHGMVFGRGHLSWEWDMENALRSPLHPLLYAAPLQLVKYVNCDWGFVVNWLPNLVQAVLFSFADVCYFKFLQRLLQSNSDAVRVAMLLYLSNWFVLYCCDRTLANTVETALMLIALPQYDCQAVQEKQMGRARPLLPTMLYLLCAAGAAIVRPTAVLLWAPLLFRDILDLLNRGEVSRLIRTAAVVGMSVTSASIVLDSCYYRRPTFAMWNFAQFNLLRGGSKHFGVHPWHWYTRCGLPALLTTLFPLLLIVLLREALESWSSESADHDAADDRDGGIPPIQRHSEISKRYLYTAMLYVAVHSAIAHKEHRFLLPVIPLLLPYLAVEIVRWSPLIGKYFVKATLIINVSLALYFGMVHQRGPYSSARVLRQLGAEAHFANGTNEPIMKILQLMPCFSMPHHSAIYPLRVHIRMLDCSPRIGGERWGAMVDGAVEDGVEEANDIHDEADQFHDDPIGWLRTRWEWPDAGLRDGNVVVAFEKTYRVIEPFLRSKGFKLVSTVFHAHFLMSSRQDHAIVIAAKMERIEGE